MDYGPRGSLNEEGISEDEIAAVEASIAEATRATFEEYEVELKEAETVIDAVQTEIFETVLRFGDSLDRTVREQFDMLADDFEDPTSTSARSNIVYTMGALDHDSEVSHLTRELSGTILARNYEHGHQL